MVGILRRPAAQRTGLRLAVELAARALQLMVLITVARTFDEESFGALMVGATAGLIAAQVADLGLTLVIGADVARAGRHVPALLTTALLLKTVLWGISACLLMVLHPLLGSGEAATGAVILASALSFDTFVQFSAGALRAAGFFKLDWFVAVLPRALASAIVIPTALLAHDIITVALAWFVAAALAAAGSVVVLVRNLSMVAPDLRLISMLLHRAWPIGASIVAGMAYTRMAVFFLEGIRSRDEVAVYVVALRLIEPAYVLPAAAGAIFYPAYARLVGNDAEAARSQLRRWTLAIAAIGGALYAAAALGGEWVASALFGEFYGDSGVLLRVLGLVLIPGFVSYLLNQALIAKGMARYNLLVMGFLLLVSIAANPIAIQGWGLVGAAWVAVILEVILLAAFWRRAVHRRPVSGLRDRGELEGRP
ncbi:MAG: oligosaccharide flippase family protein [Chloroflexi bacterium]|nr:oligosaccharide flippase family protein [Chloroflexota bacterium]